ncbi:MAG TPA: hypothetical protein VMA55_10735 [Acidovorax sp.]|nr:hypothetical protein [Acidovorax sp.]
MINALIRIIRRWFGHSAPDQPVILVDREGVAYPPRRRVVLKASRL